MRKISISATVIILAQFLAVLFSGLGYAQEDIAKFPSRPMTFINQERKDEIPCNHPDCGSGAPMRVAPPDITLRALPEEVKYG
jgi:hypothetical protein